MTKREKIIVALMTIAAVGAAVDFLILPDSTDPEADGTVEPDTVITQVQGDLARLQLDPYRERILQRVSTEWRHDLFGPEEPVTIDDFPDDAPAPETGLPAFTGYFNINGKSLGIIDGQDYTEGDWLDDGSFQILRISSGDAELLPATGSETVIIQLETTP